MILYIFPAASSAILIIGSLYLLFSRRTSFTYRFLGILLLGLAGVEFFHAMTMRAGLPDQALLWHTRALRGLIVASCAGSLFSLVFLRDNAREMFRQWRVFWVFLLVSALGLLLLSTKAIVSDINMLYGGYGFVLNRSGSLILIYLLINFVFTLLNFELTYRSSLGIQRKKITASLRWMGFVVAVYFILISIALLFSYIDTRYLPLISLSVCVVSGLGIFSFFSKGGPREQVRVSRQSLYTSATLLIVGIYLLLIGILAKIFMVMGVNIQTFLSFLAALFVFFIFLFLLFSPVIKKQARLAVDRSFYRGEHDFRREWAAVSEQVGTILELDRLVMAAQAMVREVLNVNGADIAFSSRFTDNTPLDDLLEWLVRCGQAVTIDELRERAPDLYARNKIFLTEKQAAAIIALTARQKKLGMLIIGKKADDSGFSQEDRDLLKNISRQVAVGVLNARLSEELIASREMENFNKFSSFLIHDLKNCVSMLSMIIQNAKADFGSPQFRKAAFTTLEGTIQRMNNLIGKFSTLPKTLELNRKKTGINRFLEKMLTQALERNTARIKIVKDFSPVPDIEMDQDLMEKVFINLVINAVEAMPEGGTLTIGTSSMPAPQGEGKKGVVVRVADTGSGMSREFLEKKLFRPFQSSKRKGIGLGLYQCRTIVEAHGGAIDVESEEGKGTVFYVRLPL